MRSRLRIVYSFCFAAALVVIGASAHAGMQLTFDDPEPRLVSGYRPALTDFFFGRRDETILALIPQYNFAPKVVASHAEGNYLTFNTEYRAGKSLVPVSVEGTKYNAFRKNLYLRKRFAFMGQKSFDTQQKQTGPGGVSIGVGLPKQLDRVFGEGGGNLRVTGYRRISFSGRSNWTDGASADALQQSKFPSLLMDQVYRFDIEGTIGTKISVKVSEDSQTDIPLSNRIQLRYHGDDDDILKSVEAGNTNLSLPNTQFVGYSSQIQGLFGLKADAQVGNLKLTAIASQEKGSSERATVSAAGDEKAQYHRDYEYVENRIFDLYPGHLAKGDVVKDLYVYEADQSSSGSSQSYFADLRVDPSDSVTYSGYDNNNRGLRMILIDQTQYQVVNDSARNLHYVVFATQQSERAIGVQMTIRKANDSIIQVGKTDKVDTLKLLMIRPAIGYKPDHPTWKLMWRNIYNIPRNSAAADLNIKIFKGANGTEGSSGNTDIQEKDGTYLKILGLDQYDGSGGSQSDGVLDDRQEVFRSNDWGLLIFPNRRPFDSDTTFTIAGSKTAPLIERAPKIYDYTSDKEKVDNSKYYYQISSKVRGAIINLNRANIIEGSERVTCNGTRLTRGVDYNIDYSFGRVTLLSAVATDPNAAVNVDFEYAPFLTLQKKTLLGFRGEYQYSENLKIGSTVLYKSDKAQDRKPRVGQETAKMTVIDFDGTWKLYPEFLTKMINALPLIATEAPSTLTISGEVAESHPNPNVSNEAYVDDFEAALEQLNLPNSRTSWQMSAVPAQLDTLKYQRSKLLWHNVVGGIAVDSVYDRQSKQGEGSINLFRMVFRPNNKKITLDTVTNIADTTYKKSWGGITTYFGSAVDPYRAQLFEVRLKGGRGKLHFDFGQVSEDINGNARADTEDKNGNQACEVEEDIGLDTLPDPLEPGYDPVTNPDPDGDDFYSNGVGKCPLGHDSCSNKDVIARFSNPNDPIYYEYLNGTEGNLADIAVAGQPDEEKLSRNAWNSTNAYFSFKINLADTVSDSSFYVQKSNLNGWRTYRIPIRDSLAMDTSISTGTQRPDWASITHVRVWVEEDETDTIPDTIEVANWYFVQSNWQDSLVTRRGHDTTTTFVIASVSTEDHVFVPPPGVSAYTDPTTNVTEPQRGLAMSYKNIHSTDTCLAIKKLASIDTYSGYRRMKMYVHGETDAGRNDSIEFFLRLGPDSLNYYEYHTLVHPDWDPDNYVDIDFNEITALKDAAQRALPKGKSYQTVDTTDGHYRVKGNPSINVIQYYQAGIVNLDTTKTATGTIWLDELRVTDVRRDVGQAGRIEFNGTLADLGGYNVRYESRNPYFRGISATTRGGSSDNLGSGQTDKTLSISTSLNLEKFVPRAWGASLPIGYSYTKSTQTPVLRTGSDIVLPVELRTKERSESVTKSFRFSEGFSYKGRSPLFNFFLNRQKTNFSYSRNSSFDVNRPYSFGENYNVSGSFDMGIPKVPSISLFSWGKSIPILKKTKGTRLFFWPTAWTWNGTFDRTLSINDDINKVRVSSLRRGLDLRSSLEYKLFENLSTHFDWTSKFDLSNPDDVNLKRLKLGLETGYMQNFNATYGPRLFNWIGTGLSYTASYSDNYDRSTASRYSTLSRSWSIGGDFKHQVLLGRKESSAGSYQTQVQKPKPKPGTPAVKDKKKPSKPFYQHLLSGLRFVTGWIDPIQYKYGESYNASVPGMVKRPSWSYRFGLYQDPGVHTTGDTRTPSSTDGRSYEVTSRFRVLGGIATSLGYKTSVNRDLVKQGTRGERRSTSWPDLDITISKFSTFPLIKKQLNHFIQVFEPQTAFSREIHEERNRDLNFQTAYTVTTSYNPLLSVRFKVWRALSMSSSYGLTKSTNDISSPLTGDLQKESRTTQKTMTVTARYSFRAPTGISLPIFGKLKVTSTVNMQVDVRQGSSKTETSNNGKSFATYEDKSDFVVSPTISYSFSQQIQGGLTGMWQDTNDNYLHKKSHVRQLQIWAEIKF